MITLRQLEKQLSNSLESLYDLHEAASISRIVLEYLINKSGVSYLIARNSILDEGLQKRFDLIKDRLLQSEPVQYIIGETAFYDLKFLLNKSTLIPRLETEELVNMIINENSGREGLNILDIGTGSGCIAISLAKNIPSANVYAVDISIEAINIAKENAIINSVDVNFVKADALNSCTNPFDVKFDIIVSNPPYVLESERKSMLKNVLDFEPEIALFVPNSDSLRFYSAILKNKTLIKDDSIFYFEINERLSKEMIELAKTNGFMNAICFKDLFNRFRIMKARK